MVKCLVYVLCVSTSFYKKSQEQEQQEQEQEQEQQQLLNYYTAMLAVKMSTFFLYIIR